MSLINKMLQDLESRNSQGVSTGSATGPVRAVPQPRRSYAVWALAATVLLASVGAGAWLLWGHQIVPPVATAPVVTSMRAPGLKMSVDIPPAAPTTMIAAPVQVDAPVVVASKVDPPLVRASTNNEIEKSKDQIQAASKPDAKANETTSEKASDSASEKFAAKQGGLKNPKLDAPLPTDPVIPPRPAVPTIVPTLSAPAPAIAVRNPPAKWPAVQGNNAVENQNTALADSRNPVVRQIREATPAQRADGEFRKATAQIDDGRTADAIVTLEQVLQIDPLHGAARQTLVGLLIQAKRQDEAIRKLQDGLRQDSTQPGAAMILARLQVERGEQAQAVGTLQRTLPYAADRADYQSFLAALLQREGRHKEAVEKYSAALGKAPQNGVWWMGMAISLQADNRGAEAREAFLRAKATSTLSPDLVAFVDQKLVQLGR